MKVRTNLFDIIINILCIGMLIGFGIFLILNWDKVPEQAPAQYNFSSEVTRWASKNEILFVMPLMAFGTFILITILEQFPRIWNLPVRATAANAGIIYRLTKNMIGCLKITMVGLFILIPVFQIRAVSLPLWTIFALVGVLFVVVVGHVIAMVINR